MQASAGATLNLTRNSYELMEEYAALLFGGETADSQTQTVPLTLHEYSEAVLGTYIGYDSISFNDAGQIQYTYRKYNRDGDIQGARNLCDSYADYLEHECGFTRAHEGNKGNYHYEYVLRKAAGDAQYEITLDFWRSGSVMGGEITAAYNDAFAALYPELTGNSASTGSSDGKQQCGYCFGSGNCTACGGTAACASCWPAQPNGLSRTALPVGLRAPATAVSAAAKAIIEVPSRMGRKNSKSG